MTVRNVINLYEKRDWETRVCANPRCGEAFITQNPTQRYCDPLCGARSRSMAEYQRKRALGFRKVARGGGWQKRDEVAA